MFRPRMRIALVFACVAGIALVEVDSFADTSCTKLEFACDHGKTCLPKRWLCDGEPDCRDETDEMVENCVEKPSRNCSTWEFTCNNKQCIPMSWKCDGADDCKDNSDEDQCLNNCESNEFKCGDNQCITARWKCDGMSDCLDGSDEKNCTMSDFPPELQNNSTAGANNTNNTLNNVEYFYCDHAHRLPVSYKCDGDKDCLDGTDESTCEGVVTNAPRVLCLSDREFQCSNTYCILKTWVCDGMADCQGAEDEKNCPNKTCTDQQFSCASGECIPYHEKCNGFPDCRDRTDEKNCDVPKIEESTELCNETSHFKCDTGVCIPRVQLCDLVDNCGNAQDESEVVCGVNECEHNNGGCAHQCVDAKHGYSCACNKGYRLIGKYSCEDVDECSELPGSCSQMCANTEGSFHCSCQVGYLRDPTDYKRCKAAVGEAYLLFSHSYDIRSLRLRDRDMTSVVSGTHGATALDFHYEHNKILWSDRKEKKIFRADMSDTENHEVVVSGQEVSADGLAVDWIHSLIYYTDTSQFAVKMVSWDNELTKTLVKEDVGHPRAIAVSPMSGYVYWSDWGQAPKIERAGLDGSHREAIIGHPHVAWPNGITIDHSTDRLYWCDGRLNTISSSRLDGSHIEVILFSPSILRLPYSISVFEDRLYWTDWSQLALYSANKFKGNDVHNVTAGYTLESPKVVHVFHQYRQPKGINVCVDHPCSHICVRSIYGARLCTCPDSLFMQADNVTCIETQVIEVHNEINSLPDLPYVSDLPDVVLSPINRGPIDEVTREEFDHVMILNTKNEALVDANSNETLSDVTSNNLGLILGVALGIIAGLVLGFVLYIGFTRLHKPATKRLRFHNPVYRKTTDDEPDDGRGFTIAQEQLFYHPTREYSRPDATLTMTEADDAPLTPEDDCDV